MNNYPKYAEVNGKKYNINSDFRVAIECNRIAEDLSIKDFERSLGIICTLFGKEALDNPNDWEELLKIALKFLACGKEIENGSNKQEKKDMDYIEDAGYISSSFQYDYHYNPYEMKYLHWWKFFNDLSNLSNSEMGNCCVLNRVRNLRNFDVREIKDAKERKKIIEAKEMVKLKSTIKKPKKKITEKEKNSAMEFIEKLKMQKR